MRRILVVASWVLATFLTAVVAWSAVNLAGEQVTDQPVRPLSSTELNALPSATAPTTTTTTLAGATTSLPATTTSLPGLTTSTTDGSSSTSSTSPPGTSPTTSTSLPPSSSSTSTTSTTSPGSSSTSTTSTTVPSSTSTTSTTTAATEQSAYQLIGGSVVISHSPGTVQLVSATPKAGFTVEIENNGPDEVEVEFRSATHRSKFSAEWSNGKLDVKIEEEEDD